MTVGSAYDTEEILKAGSVLESNRTTWKKMLEESRDGKLDGSSECRGQESSARLGLVLLKF